MNARELLSDPENAKAYQTLCDNPRGSTRAWADKAGWTHSKMVRFLEALRLAGLGDITPLGRRGSLFRNVPERSGPLGLGTKGQSKTGTRSAGTSPPIADPEGARLIAAMNAGFSRRPEAKVEPILEDNFGSLAAAKRILAKVPVDRAVPLVEDACRDFNPSHSGDGDWPHSLGHPFFLRYVVHAYQLAQKELDAGQRSFLFVEAAPRYQKYVPPANDRPIADPETVDNVGQEWRAIANSPHRPRRA